MAKLRVTLGQRFGRLMLIELGSNQNGYIDRVLCECGTMKDVRRADLQSGSTLSCGCLRRENAARVGASTRTHGQSKTPLYHLWHTMIARCHTPTHTAYRYYGGRGIQVCARWRESFDAFVADIGPRPVGLEIDRIDPDGNYEPGNVRWADQQTQKMNRANRSGNYQPRRFTWNGQEYGVSELASIAGMSYGMMYSRLMKGISAQTIISELTSQKTHDERPAGAS